LAAGGWRPAAGGSGEDVTRVTMRLMTEVPSAAWPYRRAGWALGGTPPNEMFSLIDQEIRRDSRPGSACEEVYGTVR